MTETIQPHAIRIDTTEPAPTELAVGSRLVSHVTVRCEAGCSLAGAKANFVAPGNSDAVYELAPEDGSAGAVIAFDAPRTVGEHEWRVTFPAQTVAGIPHQESTLCVSIRTSPHQSSLAVWDIPSPV